MISKISLLGILLGFLCSVAFAEDPEFVTKVKSFVEKKGACRLAAMTYSSKTWKVDLMYSPMERVWCVTDFVNNEGTINEESGCSLVGYNVTTNKYEPVLPGGFVPMAKNKNCGVGGFEELLEKKTGSFACSTVEECLSYFPPGSDTRVLVYASGAKYTEWFNGIDARKNAKEAKASELLKQKKGGGKK